jgi:hypothetical protein
MASFSNTQNLIHTTALHAGGFPKTYSLSGFEPGSSAFQIKQDDGQ